LPNLHRLTWTLCALLVSSSAVAESSPIPVIDLHVDLSYEYNFRGKEFADPAGQFSVDALTRGHVSGVVLPLFVPRSVRPEGPNADDLERSWSRVNAALQAPPFASPGCGTEEAQRVRTFFAFEGAGALASDPNALETWRARGLRIVGLVHTYANELASSSGDAPPKAHGLTARGRSFVRRALELGLVIDVSHASDRAVSDVLALAGPRRGVVVATHSNARALANHPRNLSDEQLRAIAATGGVIGVNFHGPFLARGRRARLSDVVAQVRHLVRVAGVEHVAIGSDFEGDIRPPAELGDASRFPVLAAALRKAGLDEPAVRKIFAENAWRVLCPTP